MKGRSKQGLLESKKKIGGNHTFLEIIKKQFWKVLKYKAMYLYSFFFVKLKLFDLWKMHGYPQFSFEIPRALAKFCFLCIV